jgi:hypothetical protein
MKQQSKVIRVITYKAFVMGCDCIQDADIKHNLHKKVKVKQSLYTPWRRLGEEV